MSSIGQYKVCLCNQHGITCAVNHKISTEKKKLITAAVCQEKLEDQGRSETGLLLWISPDRHTAIVGRVRLQAVESVHKH